MRNVNIQRPLHLLASRHETDAMFHQFRTKNFVHSNFFTGGRTSYARKKTYVPPKTWANFPFLFSLIGKIHTGKNTLRSEQEVRTCPVFCPLEKSGYVIGDVSTLCSVIFALFFLFLCLISPKICTLSTTSKV